MVTVSSTEGGRPHVKRVRRGMNDSTRFLVLSWLLVSVLGPSALHAQDMDAGSRSAESPTGVTGEQGEAAVSEDSEGSLPAPVEGSSDAPAVASEPLSVTAAPSVASTPVASTPVASTPVASTPVAGTPAESTPRTTEECQQEPVFDPSTPRLELQVGGGYAALFHTWRQTADNFMAAGRHADGLYHGPLFRGEVAFAFGGISLSAIYTHLFLTHDGMPDNVQLGLVSGEVGVQCACRGSQYVWSFGVEVGGDVLNGPSTTIFLSIEHRSMFYVYEGLFLGFDIDFATFIGLTSNGASGGGILGSLFLGYSIG